MNFFQRIGNAFSRFMYGRNKADQLSICTIWAVILLELVGMFLRSHETAYTILSWLTTLLAIWALFRMFSKNLPKRRAENAWFLQKIWNPIRFGAQNRKARSMDKEHRYFTCPACRTVCRVPCGKGKIIITCPKCGGAIHAKS